ncbi:MAG: MFS transporter [Armatimonadetes bacterium]|nr:MFS transporter [Armatimonadota bacterium]
MRGLWGVLLLISAGRFLAFVARMDIVPFYPELMARYGTTYTGAGALFTAFFVGYVLSMIPSGLAADRWQSDLQIALGFLIMGLCNIAVALTTSYTLALGARVVQGIGVAMVFMGVLKLVAVSFTRGNRGKAVGVMEVATGLGLLTALTIFPVLSRWIDYRWLMLSLPVMCVAVVVAMIALRRSAPSGEAARARPGPPLRSLLGWDLLCITLTTFLGLFCYNGLLGWLPTHLSLLGYSKAGAGAVNGVILAASMAGVYPAGSLSDRIGRRVPVVNVGSLIMIAGFLGLLVVKGGAAMYALAALIGLGMSMAVTPMTILTTEMFGPERAGVISAITVAVAQVGTGLTGVVFGWVLDRTGSFTAVWLLATLLSALRLPTAAGIGEMRRRALPAPASE